MRGADGNDALPDGWTQTTLGRLVNSIQPGFASGKHSSNGEGLPHLRPMNVTRQGEVDRKELRSVDPALASKDTRRLRRGDVVFNNTNSLDLVGKTALFDDDDEPAFSNHMTRLRVRDGVADAAFIAKYLHGRWLDGEFKQLANNHVSQASVSRDVLARLEVDLPPLAEQRRIAERLGEIEARRVSIVARLRDARTIVDRLRSAVLAAACSGRLTADWREEHRDELSAETERGSEPADTRRRRLAGPAVDMPLPELPEGYVGSTVGTAAEVVEYGTSRRCDARPEDGIPVLRMGNIQDGRLATTDLKYCEEDHEIGRLLLQDGDLLFNRTNSPDLVGKSAVFHEDVPMSFASYLIRVRFRRNIANPDFVNLWLNSIFGRGWARHVKTDGVSQSNINGTKLASMPLPLPPIAEQDEIVRRASRALSVADRLADRIQRTTERLDASMRAALAKAFRGELVPTEAELAEREGRRYETAEELLARVDGSTPASERQ